LFATNAGLFLERSARRWRTQDRLDAAEAAGEPRPMAAAGDPGSHGWDADACHIVRDYVIEHLAELTMRCSFDSTRTGFLTAGKASCGSGAAIHWFGGQDHDMPGSASFAAYVSRRSIAFIDRASVSSEGIGPTIGRPSEAAYGPRRRLCDQTKALRPE